MRSRSIRPLRGPLRATVRAVPSKSVTHRALVAAALADGPGVVVDPLDADDTRATLEGLSALGLRTSASPGRWSVDGRGGAIPGGGDLFLGDSGTSLRLLLAVAALGAESSRLDGSPRLRERPTAELVGALSGLGATVRTTPGGGGLPLEAGGSPLHGGSVRLSASRSSQFASALLLIGPHLAGGLDLTLEPPAVSLPYVEITTSVLAEYGVAIDRPARLRWVVRPGSFAGREFRVEGDHSSASYFLAAAAILGGAVRVDGIRPESLQPDARLGRILEGLGCRVDRGPDWIEVHGTGEIEGFEVDLTEAPDLAPTVAVLALVARGPSTLTGVSHLRLKESDRLEMLARNIRALGRGATAHEDRLAIEPAQADPRGSRIETASDHRLAMAFAVAGLRIPGVALDDDACVAKSNPGFWAQLERLYA